MSAASFISDARAQSWPLKRPFTISRGSIKEAHVALVTVSDGEFTGRGEGVPSLRYQENVSSVLEQLETLKGEVLDSSKLLELLPPGAARNALDCALWDLEAKRSGKRIWELREISVVSEVQTAFTISLDTPAAMGAAALRNADWPMLKIKLAGNEDDLQRVREVKASAPKARLIIDANESWSVRHYREIVPDLAQIGIELIEQPFASKDDVALASLARPVPVCADESCHTTVDLPRVIGRYDAINIKLDKTGGLTEAMELSRDARAAGLKLFFGCMICTSLGVAPARILPGPMDYVDLDGPLWLAGDRHNRLRYDHGKLALPARELWG